MDQHEIGFDNQTSFFNKISLFVSSENKVKISNINIVDTWQKRIKIKR